MGFCASFFVGAHLQLLKSLDDTPYFIY